MAPRGSDLAPSDVFHILFSGLHFLCFIPFVLTLLIESGLFKYGFNSANSGLYFKNNVLSLELQNESVCSCFLE